MVIGMSMMVGSTAGLNPGSLSMGSRNIANAAARGISVSKSNTSSKKPKTKRLNYNFKEISGRVLRAKKSVSANQVVIAARGKVAGLRRKMGTGEYNDRELAAAIIHAEKMLQVAKKKMKHLKEEERAERSGIMSEIEEFEEESKNGFSDGFFEDIFGSAGMGGMQAGAAGIDRIHLEEELRALMQEMEQEMQELLEDSGGLEELSDELLGGGPMSEEELEMWKKKHRVDEMKDIIDADMKYLKALFDMMAKEQQESAGNIIFEMSNTITAPTISTISVQVEGGTVDVSI